MTKKYSTKKALVASMLSLLLCFSMLIGTTFAWFTDSVTSANNIITSGNLDVELQYWNGTAWADVEGKSDILTNTLWEPGVVEVAYLRVANAGSLALKYQLGINIVSETAGKNVAGGEFLLSDYIQFGVVENVNGETGAYANREAAVAAVTDAKIISAGYAKAASMTAGQELYLALVVYMPTTVGNEANHNGTNIPEINLGINVFATQVENEEDAFGPDYDADAPIVSAPVTRPATGGTEDLELNSSVVEGGLSVDLPATLVDSLPAEVTGMSIAATAPVAGTNTSGEKTLTFSELTVVDQNGKEIDLSNNTTPVTVTLNVKGVYENGDYVVIYHDDVAIATATVVNDTITYTTAHFCEVVVSGSELMPDFVADAAALKAAVAAGGYYILSADIELDADETITVPAGVTVTLDLNGYTIAGVSNETGKNKSVIVVGNGGDLTVKNGTVTIEHVGANMEWNNSTNALEAVSGGKLTIDHVTVKNLGGSDMAYAINIGNNGGATFKSIASTIESVNYNAFRVFNNADGAIKVDFTEGTVLTGSGSPFFVHFWSEADLGDKQAARQAYLTVNFNDTKVSRYSGSKSLLRYGFTNAIYFSSTEMTEVVAGNAKAFTYALNNDLNVLFNTDISFTGVTQLPDRNNYVEAYGNRVGFAQYGGVIDGNGYTLTDEMDDASYVIVTHGGTIKNLKITTGARGIVTYSPTENVYIDNVVVDGAGYAINSTEQTAVDIVVTNSTVNGWTSLAGFKSVVFENCKLGENSAKYWQGMGYDQDYDRLFRVYSPTTFTGCEFEQGYYLDMSAGGTATLTNCTVNGVVLTAENYADYITVELPADVALADCVTFD